MSNLLVNIVIPTTGDRPDFLKQAQKLIDAQTVEPERQHIIKQKIGVTHGFRKGYEALDDNAIMICWEDDDWYPSDYIETVKEEFIMDPDLMMLGFSQTIYYHLGLRKWTTLDHPGRSSMFQTVIRKGLDIDWPADDYNFLDLDLWKQAEKKGWKTRLIDYSVAIGIKHGIGKCGGSGHLKTFPYEHEDKTLEALSVFTDKDQFYINLSNKLYGS